MCSHWKFSLTIASASGSPHGTIWWPWQTPILNWPTFTTFCSGYTKFWKYPTKLAVVVLNSLLSAYLKDSEQLKQGLVPVRFYEYIFFKVYVTYKAMWQVDWHLFLSQMITVVGFLLVKTLIFIILLKRGDVSSTNIIMIIVSKTKGKLTTLWQQGWHSGESTGLPPMWPRFASLTHHVWVEYVGSLFCPERFFSAYSISPLPPKTNASFAVPSISKVTMLS